MKILLRKGHHSVYDDLIKYPPKNVEYIIPKYVTASSNKIIDKTKKFAYKYYLKVFNQPHSIYVNPKGTDLIHATSGILIKNKFPWVIDTEHVSSFVGFEAGRIEKLKLKVEKILSSKYCKKIMPWTEAGKKSISSALNISKFKHKIEVVYPAMHPVNIKKEKHDKINLLFISVRFFTKGGKEVLEAYEVLKKKYDISLTIISNVPENIKKKYPNINFFEPNIPRDKILKNFFSKTDIFVLPSYMDTFGMVFLEAMNYKIPIISTNVFAIPEIIKGCGFTIDVSDFSWYGKDQLFAWNSWNRFSRYCKEVDKPNIVNDIVNYASILIENSSLRTKFGKEGRKQIESGKFSLNKRNNKLKEIYEKAIKY